MAGALVNEAQQQQKAADPVDSAALAAGRPAPDDAAAANAAAAAAASGTAEAAAPAAAAAAAATGGKQQQLAAKVSQECLIKHPLHNSWTLWYFHQEPSRSWEDLQHKITSFETVEDFWSLYNHIRVASQIGNNNDYSLFKRNIRPMWEDDANKRGGRWVFMLKSQQRPHLDQMWLDIVLCLIGEAFENSDDICGAVVNVRSRGDKLAIWTANANNQAGVMKIGRKLREALRLPNDISLSYEMHASKNKTKMYVA